jgi:hypothetical protein
MRLRRELKLYPDHVEQHVAGARGRNTGFNVKYALLPSAPDYRTWRQNDMFLAFPLLLVPGLSLFELAYRKNDDAFQLLVFMFFFCIACCAIGYVLRRLLKRDYIVLATQAGNLLIVKDGKHHRILNELQTRRTEALKRAVFVNRLNQPWQEVKKFKWLRDEGIISDDSFKIYREQILSLADAKIGNGFKTPALH